MKDDKYYNAEIDDEVGEVLRAGCISVVVFIAAILLSLIVSLLFFSCTTTKYVTVPEYHTDTVMIHQQSRDSIWLHDSIHVWQGADTVRIEKWHTKYVDRWRTDTVYQSRIDSVPKPFPVKVEVEKELNWWQRVRLSLANILLWLLAIIAGVKLYRWWSHRP